MPWVFAIAAVVEGAVSITQSIQSADQSKKATEAAAGQQAAATAELQQSQQTASTQAQNALTAKRAAAASSTDIFTSPLGLATQATTAKKTLTGQ
jgi:hypothetical protein